MIISETVVYGGGLINSDIFRGVSDILSSSSM